MTASKSPPGRQKKTPTPEPLLELWLPPDPQAVPRARHEAAQACTQAGVTRVECDALDVALGEALTNAVLHGAPRDEEGDQDAERDKHICVRLWDYHEHLIVQINDHGPGFDPPAPPYVMPTPGDLATHGRGLPLMQMLTDALVVCRGDAPEGGASIYLVKKLSRRGDN